MKKLLLICLLFACSYNARAQDVIYEDAYAHHQFGIGLGGGRYLISGIFGSEDAFTAPNLFIMYRYRPARHFQLGLSTEFAANIQGNTAFAGVFHVSFPIGRGPVSFYPGCHLRYMNTDYGSAVGPGIQLGILSQVTPHLAINVETQGTVMIFGTYTGLNAGVLLTL